MNENDVIRVLAPELDDHPSYEMLASVIDGTADDVTREIVESHAEACETCAAELRDLRAFAKPARSRALWWSAAAAAAVVVIAMIVLSTIRPAGAPPRVRDVAIVTTPPPATGYAREEWTHAVSEALRTGRLAIPNDLRSFAAPDAFRGRDRGASAIRLSPAATAVIETQPRFTWSGVVADDYEVRVYAGDREVARSPRLKTTSWISPRALDRGRTYRWQVVAQRAGESSVIPLPPSPPAVFHIVDDAVAAELRHAAASHPDDDLLLGILHAKAGVLEEARAHLSRSNAPAARRLLEDLERSR